MATDLHLLDWIAQEILLIVYVLLAALFMLIGVTAVSSLDFTSRKRH